MTEYTPCCALLCRIVVVHEVPAHFAAWENVVLAAVDDVETDARLPCQNLGENWAKAQTFPDLTRPPISATSQTLSGLERSLKV